MAEARIGFLYKAASMLPAATSNETLEKLKSYYRMRCKEISKGYGLPQKQFSEQIMCTYCCLEWRRDTAIKVKGIKLRGRQKKRIHLQKKLANKANGEHLLQSNKIVKTCAFCKHSLETVMLKPNKAIETKTQQLIGEINVKLPKKFGNVDLKNKQACDVYSNTVQVFSLKNKKNSLKRITKEPMKIKNNKKKKDKFAGLCQKAVLMSAQLKQARVKQNKLSLFLKPSS